jgi:hypothetical protein
MRRNGDDSSSKKRPTIDELLDKSLAQTREQKQREAERLQREATELAAVRAGQKADRLKHDILAVKQFIQNVITAKERDYLYREIEPEDRNIFSHLRKVSQRSNDLPEHQREDVMMLLHKCVADFTADDIEMLTDFVNKAESGQYPLLSSLSENVDGFRLASSIPDILVNTIQQRLEFLRPGQVEEIRLTTSNSGFFTRPNPVNDEVRSFKVDGKETAFIKSLYASEPKALARSIKKPPQDTSEDTMNLMQQCHSLNQVITCIGKIKNEKCRNTLLEIVSNRGDTGKHPTEYLTAIGTEILRMNSEKMLDKNSLQQAKKMAQEIDRTCGITIFDRLTDPAATAVKSGKPGMRK